MNAETIRKNTLENQAWLERALLALHKANKWHNEEDAKTGNYMVNWINRQRERKVAIGQCLTGDMWPGRARSLIQDYILDLMEIAFEKAKNEADAYYKAARKAKARMRQLKKELVKERKGAATPAPCS